MRDTDSDSDEIGEWVNQIHCGDAVDQLTQLPDSSIHMCMTSPPYFGLRDYGADGQIGLEDSLDAYIQELVDVGDALKRVLRDDGSWWLNLGDSYQDKQKQLVPHKVAIALQETGWIVRNDATWVKPNPMPQSVKDRLNTTTEQIFHLVPERDYWYDLDAIRAPHKQQTRERRDRAETDRSEYNKYKGGEPFANHSLDDAPIHPSGKNPGDVVEVTAKPFPEAHFAVYPPELCEKPIKATCPPKVCTECGTPFEREAQVEVPAPDANPTRQNAKRARELAEKHDLADEHKQAIRSFGLHDADYGDAQSMSSSKLKALTQEAKEALGAYFREYTITVSQEDRWVQTCKCETDATEPGIVLDPFVGAGTTCMVAKNLQRRFIGIDLNDEYVAMAQDRVGISVDNPDHLREDDAQSGIETFAADGGE
jgi:DNA modification methylase